MKQYRIVFRTMVVSILPLALGIVIIPYVSGQHDHSSGQDDNPNHADEQSIKVDTHEGHGSPVVQKQKVDPVSSVDGRVAVMLSPYQKQLVNVRTTAVERKQVSVEKRTVGIVAFDETQIENINTKIMGWADVLHVDKPGQRVEKNEPLLELYSPELYSAQQEYLTAYEHCAKLNHLSNSAENGDNEEISVIVKSGYSLLDSARKRLKLWDITDEEIATLEKAGVPRDRLIIRSPASGFVIEKKVDPGQMVRPGMTLYRIANLDTVWINADVYEYELSLFKPGQKAFVVAKAYPDERFDAKVDFIYPFSEIRTRTTTARLVLDNRDGLLKPGMYVAVGIERDLGERLTVPREAVFNTGNSQYVFEEENPGHFEPKPVKIGTKVGSEYVITEGLTEGAMVVIDGNFLLDSESQLKASGGGGGHNH